MSTFYRLFVSIFLFWNLPVGAVSRPLETQSLQDKPLDLTPFLMILRDPEKRLIPAQIPSELSQFSTKQNHIYLTGKGAYWLKFDLQNSGDLPLNLALTHAYPYSDKIEIFELRDRGMIPLGIRGDSQAEQGATESFRLPFFALALAPGVSTYIVRLETRGPVHLEFSLQKYPDFVKSSRQDALFLGLLFGFGFVMLGYNLFLGIALRNKTFFVYVGYILGFVTVQGIFTGILQTIVPPSTARTFFLNEGLILFAELTAVLGSLFAIQFLDLKTRMPSLYRCLLLCFPFSLLNGMIALINVEVATTLVLITNASYSVLLLVAGVQGCLSRYRPAYFYLIAWAFLLIGSLITMARIYGLTPDSSFGTWSQFVGGVLELVLLSIALGDKINFEQEQAALQIQSLNANLSDVNRELQHHVSNVEDIVRRKTSEISTILAHLKQGVFTISQDRGIIMEEYSAYLETILETKHIAGKTIGDLIFSHARVPQDMIQQNLAAIQSCLGEKSISFQLNEAAFIHEMQWNTPGGDAKFFELEWSPILDSTNHIDKLLVSIRDVTEVRKLLEERAEQKAELEMIARIIAIPISRFESFVAHCQDFYQSCIRLLDSDPDLSPKTLQKIYLNVHTMKGMARTFRLIDLADAFHRFEDLLEIKKNQGITSTVSSATLRERLGDARKILQLYMEVNKNVLGRVQADDAQQDSKNWVRRKVARLRQVDTSLLPPAHRHLMEAVLLDMERHTSLSLEYTLSELILSMPQQASLLGRAVPEIHFRECGARLTSLGQTLTEKIFVHILNNSLDHGIESPDRRTALGKPKRGTIDIVSYLEGGNLRVEVSDDGMGLNLPRIERRAFERHYFEEGQDLTPEEIADVIFEPGFSTKDELSPVSGRGVGLDAVRAYLMNVDGSIRVEFTGPISSHGVAPFKLVLLYSQDLWISTGLEREANDGNDAA